MTIHLAENYQDIFVSHIHIQNTGFYDQLLSLCKREGGKIQGGNMTSKSTRNLTLTFT